MQGLPGAWNLVATPLHATPPHEVGTGRVPPADEATAGGTLLFLEGKKCSLARSPRPNARWAKTITPFLTVPSTAPRRSFRTRLDTTPTSGPSFCLKVTPALHATPSPQSRQRRHASTSRPASPCPVQRKRANAPPFFPSHHTQKSPAEIGGAFWKTRRAGNGGGCSRTVWMVRTTVHPRHDAHGIHDNR